MRRTQSGAAQAHGGFVSSQPREGGVFAIHIRA
jgi:hypothetical protein